MFRRRPSPALVVAFLALLVSASGVTFAAIPARDGDVHACYDKKGGAIELVDTQRDKVKCPRNWRPLVVDTTPSQLDPPGTVQTEIPPVQATSTASRLTSPNGSFKIEATNNGARMIGPKGLIEISEGRISVAGDVPVDVTGGSEVKVTGGSDVNVTGGRLISMLSGTDTNLNAAGSLNLKGGANANLEGRDDVNLRARRTVIEGFIETRIVTKDLVALASGAADLRGTPVRINGTAQSGD